MADFIGNATSSQLLFLLLVPVTGMFLLAGVLIFSSRRNRKKTQMKHGLQTKEAASAAPMLEGQPALPGEPENNDVSDEDPAPGPRLEESSAAPDNLNLDILGGKAAMEAPTMDTPNPFNEEQIDIAARLGGASATPGQPLDPAQPSAPLQVSESAQVTQVPGPSPEPAELLHFLRDSQSGRLIVEIAGKRYTKLTDIDDREVGQYVLELAAHLLAFTNGVVATRAGVKSVYLPRVDQTPLPMAKPTPVSQLPDPADFTPPAPPAESPPASEPLVPPPSPEAEAAFRASLEAIRVPQPEQPPSRGGFFGRSKSKAEPGQALSGFNLADEINKIVQARLIVSPLAETTNIEIQSALSGGIQIKVNGTIYPAPDDIPDPEVKALIKVSIKQWERS